MRGRFFKSVFLDASMFIVAQIEQLAAEQDDVSGMLAAVEGKGNKVVEAIEGKGSDAVFGSHRPMLARSSSIVTFE